MKKLIAFLGTLLICSVATASPSDMYLKDGTYYGMFDDFLGVAVDTVLDDGTTTFRTWVHKDTGSGTPTFGLLADTAAGVLDMKLAADEQEEGLVLYWNNEETIALADKPTLIVRAKIVTTDITTAESFAFGFMGGVAADPNSVAEFAFIHFDESMTPDIEVDNGATETTKASLTEFTAGVWYEFMIDVTSSSAVKFYYRATLGGDWVALTDSASAPTTFDLSGYSDATLQPAVILHKSTGATTPEVYIDYIRVIAER